MHGSQTQKTPVMRRLNFASTSLDYGADFARSGNNPTNPASLAVQMPHSVIKPVTSRAGVTSNA